MKNELESVRVDVPVAELPELRRRVEAAGLPFSKAFGAAVARGLRAEGVYDPDEEAPITESLKLRLPPLAAKTLRDCAVAHGCSLGEAALWLAKKGGGRGEN